MSDAPQAASLALATLHDQLDLLHRRAGSPSVRALARLTGPLLSHDTVHRVLRTRSVPSWTSLEPVVRALDGDPEQFRELWTAARDSSQTSEEQHSQPVTAHPAGPAGRQQAVRLRRDRHSFSDQLSPEERRDLRQLGVIRSFRPRELLARQGEPAGPVTLLVQGFVKLTASSPAGYETLLRLGTPGDLLLAERALTGRPAGSTVQALGPVEALLIPNERFRTFLADHPPASMALARTLSDELAAANARRTREAGTAMARVCAALVDLADSFDLSGDDTAGLLLPLGQSDIAALCGVSLRTCSRVMEQLRYEGVVGSTRSRLRILDVVRLRNLSATVW
ncbi:Crp/Fnr family transcriptional regulator [Kitasatospora sp. NPDC002227]|uniref:Crp/Fnr family transcriptional regulator n=1 Tax=Kitasatospora sp. NPDC002227 TaxID=3154773 RepID=UPI0033197997